MEYLKFFKKHHLGAMFFCFIALNIFLYLFIYKYSNSLPFNKVNYLQNSQHYLIDPRINGENFNLINGLGQFDAQWYLRIAGKGYPNLKNLSNSSDILTTDKLTFAFFPLYPLILGQANAIFKNIELTSFIFANLLLILIFFSLYFVISKLYNSILAYKTIFLIFLFPFSIFFRSYFSEGLFLFLLIWFSYFTIKKQHAKSALTLGLLMITRASGIFLLPILFYVFYKEIKLKKLSFKKSLFYVFIATTPLLSWIIFNFIQTGDGLFFYNVRHFWNHSGVPIIHNINLILHLPWLPVHGGHKSQLDIFTVLLISLLLMLSREKIKIELWLISFLLFLGPLLTTDTMSFTRYQIVSFPLFLYVAKTINNKVYAALLILSFLLLLGASIVFVNWYWLG